MTSHLSPDFLTIIVLGPFEVLTSIWFEGHITPEEWHFLYSRSIAHEIIQFKSLRVEVCPRNLTELVHKYSGLILVAEIG